MKQNIVSVFIFMKFLWKEWKKHVIYNNLLEHKLIVVNIHIYYTVYTIYKCKSTNEKK